VTKPVRFRREAGHDLRQILAWYETVAPQSLPNVTSDIWRAIDLVQRFPGIGMAIEGRPLRRIVTHRYRFKIAYADDPEAITVFGIFRFQDREV
jgi:plasmid stabilization system protein ParE